MQQVLVVDDELAHLNALSELLQAAGYEVLRTRQPERALAIAESAGPDLIITDWDMPGLSGVALIQQLKAHPATRDIPVIMCTGKMTSSESLETALGAGAVDYVRKPVDPIELRARVRSMLQLSASHRALLAKEEALTRQNAQLRELNALLDRQKRALHEAATVDRLTGLFNRDYLMEQLSREFSNAQRYGHPFSCLVIDVDHFKSFNDRHGHLVGDVVLRDTAQLLLRHTRRGDVLGRFGGEEFVVLLPGTPALKAAALADVLRGAVAQAVYDTGEERLQVTVSVGVADNRVGEPPNEMALLKHADEALYAAKRQGRDRVVRYTPGG
ncbi:GGDEF domain-containing response regulator [Inhella gelatinilytica]|uniref:diguanylate cyclase n=1 Tax=Inhella gelatinilytica TaxID=2795030 RepID=A0A931IZ61_9BURK|nr:diguanylate cyclase [Inhella gelatinilytica]MBH9552668.1 diguanylate cyclase [Inhella gelatinilytica]